MGAMSSGVGGGDYIFAFPAYGGGLFLAFSSREEAEAKLEEMQHIADDLDDIEDMYKDDYIASAAHYASVSIIVYRREVEHG